MISTEKPEEFFNDKTCERRMSHEKERELVKDQQQA